MGTEFNRQGKLETLQMYREFKFHETINVHIENRLLLSIKISIHKTLIVHLMWRKHRLYRLILLLINFNLLMSSTACFLCCIWSSITWISVALAWTLTKIKADKKKKHVCKWKWHLLLLSFLLGEAVKNWEDDANSWFKKEIAARFFSSLTSLNPLQN